MRSFLVAVFALAATFAQAATLPATPANFASQMKAAKAGDVVSLTPGNYGKLALYDVAYASPVTITGKGAVFDGMELKNVTGLNVVGVGFNHTCPAGAGQTPGLNPAIALKSKSLRVEGVTVTGGELCWSGLFIRESQDVVITKSEFSGVQIGAHHWGSTGLTISDSYFHHLRTDGITGGCSSFVTVTRNRFTAFQMAPGAHVDASQGFTTGCSAITTDLTITENFYWRGDVSLENASQGIFYTAGGGSPRQKRLKIADNILIGGNYTGIGVWGADDAEITGNVVLGFPDRQVFIRVEDSTNVKMSGNTTQNLVGQAADFRSATTIKPALTDRGAAILAAYQPKPPVVEPPVVTPPVEPPPVVPPAVPVDALRKALSVCTSAKVEPLKTKGRVIIECPKPADATALLPQIQGALAK